MALAGGKFWVVHLAPNEADEERAEGREAGADHSDGGFGGGPAGGGDVVPLIGVLAIASIGVFGVRFTRDVGFVHLREDYETDNADNADTARFISKRSFTCKGGPGLRQADGEDYGQ